MRLYLDDLRTPPAGWTLVHWPDEALRLIDAGGVEALSLDHDLGDDARGTGYTLMRELEERFFLFGTLPPRISVHTQNPEGRRNIFAAIASMRRRMAHAGVDGATIDALLPRSPFHSFGR